jgi:hypothetical protein
MLHYVRAPTLSVTVRLGGFQVCLCLLLGGGSYPAESHSLFQAPDVDLELVEKRTLDGHIQELTYRPSLH